ncbi:LytR/AlgR family response regulator transcription factor [Spirosoma panaciterrae]|uniref:LytR/AlgR family response regulator transcription factor n=1 Tax=Spirosoma panaciterrae TaxID=496058 RepID=UPI00039F7495|nr:response regulator transcription factor [Spirosoma panaciterrae]
MMHRYTCLILEDEPLALERTQEFVGKIPSLMLCATFDNALDGLVYLKQHPIDILFLDINMDELSGIELLESARIDSQVIMTTAYPEYALKGYELNVADYLLKPFTFNRFVQAVDKVQERLALRQPKHQPDYIFVKTENRLEKITLSDILFIEGMRDYRRIHTIDKKIMTLQNFSEFEQLIPPSQVCRVHKSYMVAIQKIESIERSRIRIANQLIPISDTYKDLFFQLINSTVQ